MHARVKNSACAGTLRTTRRRIAARCDLQNNRTFIWICNLSVRELKWVRNWVTILYIVIIMLPWVRFRFSNKIKRWKIINQNLYFLQFQLCICLFISFSMLYVVFSANPTMCIWQQPQHFLFQLANVCFALSYSAPSSKKGILFMHSLLIIGEVNFLIVKKSRKIKFQF